jgi:tetratricopeptide (TPR) repeat protein
MLLCLWCNALANEPDALLEKAKSGDVVSQYELGIRYRHQENSSSAIFWLKAAAEQGLPIAQLELGILRYQGDHFDKRVENHWEAIEWLTKAISNSKESPSEVANAQHILGNIFYQECDVFVHSKLISLDDCGSPSDRNLINLYVDGGLAYKGLIPGRPDDKVGIATAYAHVSDRARDHDRDTRIFDDPLYPVKSAE